jgi:hypothetical protein
LGLPNPFDAMILSFRAKNNDDDLDDAECDENDKFSWGRCTVSDSLLRIKKMRTVEDCDSQQSPSTELKIGSSGSNGDYSTEALYDLEQAPSLPPSPQSQISSSTSGSKSPHRLKRLENAAFRCVEVRMHLRNIFF